MTELEIARESRDCAAYVMGDVNIAPPWKERAKELYELCCRRVAAIEAAAEAAKNPPPQMTNREYMDHLNQRFAWLVDRMRYFEESQSIHEANVKIEGIETTLDRHDSLIRSANANIERVEVMGEKMADHIDRHEHTFEHKMTFCVPTEKAPR